MKILLLLNWLIYGIIAAILSKGTDGSTIIITIYLTIVFIVIIMNPRIQRDFSRAVTVTFLCF